MAALEEEENSQAQAYVLTHDNELTTQARASYLTGFDMARAYLEDILDAAGVPN